MGGTDRRAAMAWATAAVLAACVALHVAVALRLDFLSDDAFITFRYARNLARGAGLVFNPGERVEGYTNFLLVVVLGGLDFLGADLAVAGRVVSVAAGAATVVLGWAVARRLAPGSRAAPLLAAALLAPNPYLAAWSGGGLETTLFTALLLGLVLAATSERGRHGFLVPGLLGLLLGLTRPEGVLVFVVTALWAIAATPGPLRARLRALAPGLILFVAAGGLYFVLRAWYFGALLPNTFYAKGAFTMRHVRRGVEYVTAFASGPSSAVLLVLAAIGAVVAWRRAARLPVLLALALAAVVLLEGGDGLPMYRFMLPVVVLAAPLAALALAAAPGRVLRGAALGAGVAAAALSFRPPEDFQWGIFVGQRDVEIPTWSAAGRGLARLAPGATVAAVPVGALGWYSDLRVIDLVGLTDPTIARTEVRELGAGWAGHEKQNPAYVLGRRPELLLLGNVYVTDRPFVEPGELPFLRVEPIREREEGLVRHPAFAEYRLVALPLEDGLYLHCFARRDYVATLSAAVAARSRVGQATPVPPSPQ